MARTLGAGWRMQTEVIGALLIRELATRFGRRNIGFLWIMAEPLLFAVLVGVMWRFMRGSSEHGISVFAFVVSGYIPLVLFRHAVSRCVGLFSANASLMVHRQIHIADFIFARFAIEWIGHMMAYLAIAVLLMAAGVFPVPADMGLLLAGWVCYALFTLGVCFILAPLSEMSPVLERLMPVATYLMVPFSGTFHMLDWVAPDARAVLVWSPPVHAMEMMRAGLFGHQVSATFDPAYPLAVSAICLLVGLGLCRHVRRAMVVE